MNEADDALALRDWLARAQREHPQSPRVVADALRARAATLPDDADGMEAVRLAEHVMLAHLGDAPGLRALLDRLPPPPALAAARQRAAWALAALSGDPEAIDVPVASRWRALQNVVLALAHTGRWTDAVSALQEPLPQALVHPDADARKAYAATANNVAGELRAAWPPAAADDASRAAQAALMLDAAALARQAWSAAGTWLHVERAEYQLALCHAVLGRGAQAMGHATACLSICDAHGADTVERFFAHEALVHAQRAAGDMAAAAGHAQQMQGLLADIGDPDMKAWCQQTLADLHAARA